MAKYTNALYPDKINDLIDNDGNINPEVIPGETPFEWNTTLDSELPTTETTFYLILNNEDWETIANSQPLKIKAHIDIGEGFEDIDLVYSKLITAGVQYAGHVEGMVCYIDMGYNFDVQKVTAFFSISGEGPQPEPSGDNDYAGFANAVQTCYEHRNDVTYSNTWTFSFHNADTRRLESALSDLGTYNAYEALIRRATLAVNVTGTNINQKEEEDGISFGVVKPFFKIWLQSSGDENVQQMEFGYTTFSGTITLIYSDDQE